MIELYITITTAGKIGSEYETTDASISNILVNHVYQGPP